METQPLQTEKVKMSPGFFFLSLGLLITLITSVVSFINLLFEGLNKKYPDVLNASYTYGYSTYEYESMRMALATLIIFFPVFLAVSYFWKRFVRVGLGKVDEILRKWSLYIILFLSAVVIAVDLVTLVRYFVSGEVTTRFILKVLAVLVTALLVGAHYVLNLWNKDSKKINMLFGVIASVFVLSAIVWSFMVMGSPAEQRKLRLDDRRVSDLNTIQWQIINYWQQKEKLPETLNDLKDSLSSFVMPPDPEFEKGYVYEYKKLPSDKGQLKFELCATFALPMPQGWREYGGGAVMPMMDLSIEKSMSYPYPGGGFGESWDHEAGRTCFERKIDPEIYPPFPKPTTR